MVKGFLLKMGKLMLTNKGFTLIETLFVLMIICILSSLTMSLHIPKKEDKAVIEEISQLIYEAQMNAMIFKETTNVDFYKNSIVVESQHMNNEYTLEDHMSFDEHKMTFNAFGHIKNAKAITLYAKNNYQFVFQIGCGSFYVR